MAICEKQSAICNPDNTRQTSNVHQGESKTPYASQTQNNGKERRKT